MTIGLGDLDDPRIGALIAHHVELGRANADACSAHALDVSGLKTREVRFFAAWDGETLLAIGAWKKFQVAHGEIKSMHTAEAGRRNGIGAAMLAHLIADARAAGIRRLSLETGSWPYFDAARAMYRAHGFVDCEPFADYRIDPSSVYMTRAI